MTPEVVRKLDSMRAFLARFPSAIVAYSGGIDSALVMRVSHEVLGEKALACIGVSPSYPKRELRAAIEFAKQIGATYRLVYPNEIENENYAANPNNRCYFCKTELHGELVSLAAREGFAVVLDGTNADDATIDAAFRPGISAAREHGVRSPLCEAGIGKAEAREIAKHLGMAIWDKPAMACMSSRVPHGTPITPELLARIEAAEDVLYDLGLRQFRVRHHGPIARLEVSAEDFPVVLEHRSLITARFKEVGYVFTALDLAGFKSGSMNITRKPSAFAETVRTHRTE
jgi:pyridinium-3,5-biscarboxylic acid mononucleotide sulfurtransferase